MGGKIKRFAAAIAGPRPELRLIVLTLTAITYLLLLIFWELEDIDSSIPYIDNCGYLGDPCQVEIAS